MQKEKFTTEDKIQILEDGIVNSKKADSSAKIIFEDPILCSQFLHGYTQIPLLENVQPEDIEDVTERYVHMFTEERNSDVVKKVKIKDCDTPFYLISLIEHKSKVDYNSVMQILRYMVFIWEDYEKMQEKMSRGISKSKNFRYPPVLPIIYYTGSADWAAAVKLEDRVYLSDVLADYIPHFRCILVQVKDYDNVRLMEKHDELSIIMMINRMQKSTDFSKWKKEVDSEYLVDTTKLTPEYLLGIMAQVMKFLLLNINVPEQEAEDVTGLIKERRMAGLFDHFEKYDVQAARAEAMKQGLAEGLEKGLSAGMEQGLAQGMEQGIEKFVKAAQNFKVHRNEIRNQLMEQYKLTESEAEEKIGKYWNSIM